MPFNKPRRDNHYQPLSFDDFPSLQSYPCDRRAPSLVVVHALIVGQKFMKKHFVSFTILFFANIGILLSTEELLGEWSAGATTTPHNVGHERRLVFTQDGAHQFLTFKHIRHTGLQNKPEESLFGPYRIKRHEPNRIIYIIDNTEYHVTWRINPSGALEWGAIVSEDNMKWHFAREVPIPDPDNVNDDEPISLRISTGLASWRFLSDPFDVPVGGARIPGIQAGYAYYVHEKIPSFETGARPRKSIRIMTLNEDGTLSEQFRMVWHQSSGPFLEGVFVRGNNVSRIITKNFRRVSN